MKRSRNSVVGWAILVSSAVAPVDTCRTGLSSGDAGEPRVEFTVVGTPEAGDDPGLRVDSVATGEMVLAGAISTPTPCYDIRAEPSRRDGTLTLTLVATAQPRICIQVLAAFAYRARIYGLSAGRYRVEVVVTYPNTGWPPRVEHLEVEIP